METLSGRMRRRELGTRPAESRHQETDEIRRTSSEPAGQGADADSKAGATMTRKAQLPAKPVGFVETAVVPPPKPPLVCSIWGCDKPAVSSYLGKGACAEHEEECAKRLHAEQDRLNAAPKFAFGQRRARAPEN